MESAVKIPKQLISIMRLAIMSLVVLVCGCLCGGSSPAPGCNQQFVMGGCFGRAIITDITIEPKIECLKVNANNCNGGVLGVANNCKDDLKMGEYTVKPSSEKTFEFVRNGSVVEVKLARGNFAQYNPKSDEALSAVVSVGEVNSTVSYVKTGPLC